MIRLRDVLDRARYAPTRRYAALVLATAPVWVISGSSMGEMVAAAATVLVVLLALVDAIRIPAPGQVMVERVLSPTVGIGDAVAGEYRITSRWPAPFGGTVHQALPALVDSATTPQGMIHVSAAQPAIVPFTVTGRTRGTAPLGPIALQAHGPLGLVTRTLIYRAADSITVLPSISGIRRYRLLAVQHRLRTTGQRTLRRHVGTTAFANLRGYVVGDDPRHIDWKASARHQHLVSREFTVEQGQTIMLAIDAGRMMTQLAGDRPRFEYALSAAIILADVALQTGDRVGLVVFNEEIRRYVAPSRGPQTLTQIRDALAGVSATVTEPDYAAAFRTLLANHRRRSLIVLFTDVIDPRSSRAIMAHTTRSATRHLPLVVALRNEQLVETALPSADATDESAYTAVAAEELLAARSEVLFAMRQAGVAVLDTPPTAMTAALVNRYLEIKDRSLL